MNNENCHNQIVKAPKPIKLFIGGLPVTLTKTQLCKHLDSIAPLLNLRLIRDENGALSKGFAFFEVESMDDAKQFIQQSIQIEGRMLNCQIKGKNRLRTKVNRKRLHISSIPSTLTDEELRKYFSILPGLRSVYSVRKKDGRSLNFGFADFEHEQQCQDALRLGQISLGDWVVQLHRFQGSRSASRDHSNPNMTYQHDLAQLPIQTPIIPLANVNDLFFLGGPPLQQNYNNQKQQFLKDKAPRPQKYLPCHTAGRGGWLNPVCWPQYYEAHNNETLQHNRHRTQDMPSSVKDAKKDSTWLSLKQTLKNTTDRPLDDYRLNQNILETNLSDFEGQN